MALPAGSKLGPYEIIAPIGAGGMGEVYRAHDTSLSRDVAIKVLPAALAQDPDRLARFDREAKILAALNHPNIAMIHGLVESDSGRALVMELVPGETLADRIKRGPVPLAEALEIARQIAEAFEAAHEKGIVHRDLKPGNVMITPSGVVKVLDFGLAAMAQAVRSASDDQSNSPTLTMGMTQAGVIMGTAAYMAPEQAAGSQVDRRADIWSYGVVLWEMLSGRRLFSGDTVAHTLAAVLQTPVDFEQLTAPQPIKTLLRRLLDRDLKTRLQWIGEARVAIVRYVADPKGGADSPAQAGGLPHKASRLGWALASSVLIGLIAAAATAAFVYFRMTQPDTPVLRAFLPPPDKTAFNVRGGLAAASPPALSPDGRRLVFSAVSADGKNQLWIHALDALTSQPLAGTDGATHPFWSPESKFIGFFAGGKLKKIDASGGTAIALCNAASGRGATWSQNGVIVFATDRIYQVSAAGGVPSALEGVIPSGTAPTETSGNNFTPRWPSFLPDGLHFLYLAGGGGQTGGAIRVGALDSKQEGKMVVDALSNAIYAQGNLLYLREDNLVAQPFDLKSLSTTGEAVPIAEGVQSIGAARRGVFSASENGLLVYVPGGAGSDYKLGWFDRAGKPAGTLGNPGGFNEVNFSPDGKSLAVSLTDPSTRNTDLWVFDVSRGLPTRFTFDPAVESNPIWSPDGRSIFFRSTRKGLGNLYRKSADGTGVEELVYEDNLNKFPTAVSPDGKFLLYSASQASNSTMQDLWVLPLIPQGSDGARKPFPFVPGAERQGQFSPDGHWIAYVSNESGRAEIYVAPFSGASGTAGGKRQVSTSGGLLARWRKDGKEIFYIEPGGRLMAAAVSVKGATFEVGAVSPLFGPLLTGSGFQYDISADGQRFLVITQPEQTAGEPLTLVQNWLLVTKK